MALLNIGSAMVLFIALTTGGCLHHLHYTINTPLVLSLLFFNNLNILIALCEICLGLHILRIKDDYAKLLTKYKGNEFGAAVAFLTKPLGVTELLDGRVWSGMWSTYALYDPSYQNHESFGFFIDFGNGMSTIPPSVLINLAIVYPTKLSPLIVGCVGIAMYWQVMYGTIIYLLSFCFNRRYEGRGFWELTLFVGFSNSLWFFFPIVGIYASYCMLRDGNMSVFGQV